MQTVIVVDEDGATFVWPEASRDEAERFFVQEGYNHAVHLSITKADAPAGLTGDDLVEWCIENVPPRTCEAQ